MRLSQAQPSTPRSLTGGFFLMPHVGDGGGKEERKREGRILALLEALPQPGSMTSSLVPLQGWGAMWLHPSLQPCTQSGFSKHRGESFMETTMCPVLQYMT